MEHKFEGLTLLDHAINSTLVFSNIALRKGDKIGLVTFSHKIGTQIAPDAGKRQLQRILDALYAQKTEFKEANYSLLYQSLRDRKSTRLNSSHVRISYAVFCLKKKKKTK